LEKSERCGGEGGTSTDLNWRPANPNVSRFVTGFVERRDFAPMGPALELPLGYPHLQIMRAEPYYVEVAGRLAPMPRAAFWGHSFEARRAEPVAKLHAFIAVLTFEGAALLLSAPPAIVAGDIVDMEALSGPTRALAAELMESQGFAAQAAVVENGFRALAADAALDRRNSPVLAMASAIAAHRIQEPVATIAARMGLSERTLLNRFRSGIGCGPKRLLRLARLQRLLRALHPSPWGGRPVSDPLLEFFDEPHMHGEFRTLTGVTPGGFAASKSRNGDHFVHCMLEA
jgi:methylphosphotriester-DNA--protein-cysteine methyltransferase